MHFSTINITLHSALLDYKFRRQILNEFKDGEMSYKTLETGIKVVRIKTHHKKPRLTKKKKKY